MSNAPNKLIAVGFGIIGAGYLWELFRDGSAPVSPLGNHGVAGPFGLTADGMRPNLPFATIQGARQLGYAGGRELTAGDEAAGKIRHIKDGVRSIKFYPAGDIDNRLKYIIKQIREDSKQKETVTEATAILSGKCPTAKGGLKWCIPVKNWESEVKMLFYAIVNPNSPYSLRYTRDPVNYDAFRSSDLMRRIPAADCDDMTIRLGALLMAVGYTVKCRIVAPKDQPGQWAHIYLLVGTPPGENTKWIPLDPTEPYPPGWEPSNAIVSTRRDFEV